jgi:hypothetical protein
MTLDELDKLGGLLLNTAGTWTLESTGNYGAVTVNTGVPGWTYADMEFAVDAHNAAAELIDLAREALQRREKRFDLLLDEAFVEEKTPTSDFWKKYAGF